MRCALDIHNDTFFSSTLAVLYHDGDNRLDDTKLGPKVHFSTASCSGTESDISLCDIYVSYGDCSAASEVSLVCSGKFQDIGRFENKFVLVRIAGYKIFMDIGKHTYDRADKRYTHTPKRLCSHSIQVSSVSS